MQNLLRGPVVPNGVNPRRFYRPALSNPTHAVRTGRHKYIEYSDLENMNELYDLTSDPYELRNRINDPDSADIVRQLQAELRRLSS